MVLTDKETRFLALAFAAIDETPKVRADFQDAMAQLFHAKEADELGQPCLPCYFDRHDPRLR